MSSARTATTKVPKLTISLLIDRDRNRVVFAESGADFVDAILAFLTLPLGTVVRLSDSHSTLGCIDRLYASVRDLDPVHLQTPACKPMLLSPRNAAGIALHGLPLSVDDSDHRIYYRCASSARASCRISSVPGARCPCGKPTKTPFAAWGADGKERDPGFVNGSMRFIVGDDLEVRPASTGASLAMLGKLGIEDGSVLEKRTVELGNEEILGILKRSLVSMMPLTDVFLEETEIIDDVEKPAAAGIINARVEQGISSSESKKRIHLKLFLSKESDKVVYAEAGKEFVDLLFSFLTFPLGSIVKLLGSHSPMGSIINLHNSVKLLSKSNSYIKSKVHEDMLLAPKLAPYFSCNSQLLNINELVVCTQCFSTPLECRCANHIVTSCAMERNPKLNDSADDCKVGFAKEMATFMVTDEIVVTPLSPISGISIIKKLMMPFSGLEEVEASLGEAEAFGLLRACLVSGTALSETFSPTVITLLERKWCG